ncbi:MAG: hypothetical protein ACFFAX_02105 [Promethearchaeota archaeon]
MECKPRDASFNNFGEGIGFERCRYLLDCLLDIFSIATLEAFGEGIWVVIGYSLVNLAVTISGGVLWYKGEVIAREGYTNSQ